MFGYVLPPLEELPKEEAERVRRAYCGRCQTLGRRYGPAARFILNYDFTFLAILLSQGGPRSVDSRRCFASPFKKRAFLEPDGAMELAKKINAEACGRLSRAYGERSEFLTALSDSLLCRRS